MVPHDHLDGDISLLRRHLNDLLDYLFPFDELSDNLLNLNDFFYDYLFLDNSGNDPFDRHLLDHFFTSWFR